MNIAIIDAEIVGKKAHRFPNLVCMKLSSYHKANDDKVTLKLDYENLDEFDRVYISKVFIKTVIPGEPEDQSGKNELTVAKWYTDNEFLKAPNIVYGGTGFFYDTAPPLPIDIEHIMPDYHLYDEWVQMNIDAGVNPKEFTYYTDYSIGFLTRGCFRKCQFCVNQHYDRASQHSDFYRITLHCYVLGPSRHYDWDGKTWEEALAKCKADIAGWLQEEDDA